MESMETLRGLLIESPWSPHGVSVGSKGQPPLFNLLKRNHKQKQMFTAGVELGTFWNLRNYIGNYMRTQ